MLKPLLFVAVGCALATTPASAGYCSDQPPSDLNCKPDVDYLRDASLREAHAPSVQDILSHPESASFQGYVAGIKDELDMSSSIKETDGVTWRIYTFASGERACLPINVSVAFETLVAPVRDYPHAHPDGVPGYEALSFVTALPVALHWAYPCPASLR
jgi:hypothetical protein